MSTKSLGQFELTVMQALLWLGEQAYGMSVRQKISERLGKEVSIGAIYATLERLENKGYVKSRVGEVTNSRGGRAKKYFKITGAGQASLTQTISDIERMLLKSEVPALGGSVNV